MIHIHRCTFLAQEDGVWKNGSTISVNRVKNIIAKQLEGLENLPGRIHLKELTLDLGDFESLEFNNEFIERLEHSCRNLEGKLRELQRSQIDEVDQKDKAHFDDLIAFLYSLDYTQEVQNTIYLLESGGFAPKLEDWDKFESRYEKLFGTRIETQLKNPLKSMLVSSKSSKEKSTPSSPFSSNKKEKRKTDFDQEHIDYLIESLDRVPMDTNWLKTLDVWFTKEFGSKMSMELHNRIRKVYDSFEFGLKSRVERPVLEKKLNSQLDKRLLQFFKALDDSEENRIFEDWLKRLEVSGTGHFLSELISSYKRDHKRPMPIQLEKQLLRFQQQENPLSWNEVDRAKRQRIMNKLNLLKEINFKSRLVKRKAIKEGVSQEEYDFLCDQLSRLQIDAAWYAKLLANYKEEFNRAMPEKLKEIFLRFSQDLFQPEQSTSISRDKGDVSSMVKAIRAISPRSEFIVFLQTMNKVELRTHEDFIQLYRAYFGHEVNAGHAKLLNQANAFLQEQSVREAFSQNQVQFFDIFKLKDGSNKKLKADARGGQQSKFLLTPEMVQDLQFDLAWLARMDQRFQELHQRSIPRKLMRKILLFLNKTKAETPPRKLFRTEAASGRILISSIRQFLGELQTVEDSNDLLEILPAENDPQKWLDIEEIITGFERCFSRPISSKLRGMLWNHFQNSIPEQWRLISKENSKRAKAAIEAQLSDPNSKDLSESEIAKFLKEFLMIRSRLLWTKHHFMDKFQAYLKSEKGIILTKAQQLFLTRLRQEVLSNLDEQNEASKVYQELTAELSSIAKKIQSKSSNDKETKHKLEFSQKQSSGVLPTDFLNRSLDFILNFLKKTSLSKDWKTSLSDSYRSEFKSEIPNEWQAILAQYDFHSFNAMSKAAIEKQLLELNSKDKSELEMAGFLRAFLMTQTNLSWTKHSFQSDFQSYLKKEKGIILSKTQESVFTRLWQEAQSNLLTENEASGVYKQLTNELSSTAEEIKIKPSNSDKTKDEVEVPQKQSSGILHPDFVKRAIDFILNFLKESNLAKNWKSSLSDSYKTEFKSEIPDEWQAILARYDFHSINAQPKELAEDSVKSKLVVYLAQNGEVPGSEKLLRFLSEIDFTGALESLFDLYETQRNEALPMVLKMTLNRWFASLEGRSSLQKESDYEGKASDFQELIDNFVEKTLEDRDQLMYFLHFMLETVPLDACWLATVSKKYTAQFGRKMPVELFNGLMAFTKQFSQELQSSNGNTQQAEANEENLLALFDEVTMGMDATPLLERLKDILEEMSLSSRSFSVVNLAERFQQKFKEEIPSDLLEKIAGVYVKKSHYNWSMLPSKQRKTLVEEIKKVLSASVDDPKSQEVKDSGFNAKFTFLIQLLERTSIDVLWFAKLKKGYRAKFSEDMTHELKRCLLNFSMKISEKSETVSEFNNSIVRSWSALPSNDKNAFIEGVVDTLHKASDEAQSKDEQEMSFNEKFAFLMQLLEHTPIDVSWLTKLEKAYRKEFNEEMRSELKAFLLRFWQRLIFEPIEEGEGDQDSEGKDVISYFVSLHFPTEVSESFRKYLVQISESKHAFVLGEITSKYEAEFGSLSHDQKESLQELERVLLERKRFQNDGREVPGFLNELRQLNDENTAQKNQQKLDQRQVDFALSFFRESKINWESLRMFEGTFRNEFKAKMSPRMTALILKYLEYDSTSKESNFDLPNSKLQPEEKVRLSHQIDTSESVEFHIASKTFLSSKLEQLMLGWADLNQVKTEYFQGFKNEIPSGVLDFWEMKFSAKRGENSGLTHELGQFLRKFGTIGQSNTLNEILKSIDELSDRNWFESILKAYKEKFSASLPLDMQQLLLRFANQRTESEKSSSISQKDLLGKLKNQSYESWLMFVNEVKDKAKSDSNLETLKQLDFMSNWLKKSVLTRNELAVLEMKFYRKFQVSIHEDWRAELIRNLDQIGMNEIISSRSTIEPQSKDDFDQTKVGYSSKLIAHSTTKIERQEFRNELLEYIETIPSSADKNVLINVVDSLPELSKSSWFQQLVGRYKSEMSAQMPLSIQGSLLKFMQKQSVISLDDQKEEISDDLVTNNDSALFNEMNAKLNEVHLEILKADDVYFDLKRFFSALLFSKSGEFLQSQFVKEFHLWFGAEIPKSIAQIFNPLITSRHGLKVRLLEYLKTKNVSELVQVVQKIGGLSQSNWVEKIDDQCKSTHGRSISANEGNLLIAFAANDEFTMSESNEPSISSAELQAVAERLAQHIKSNERLYIRMIESYQLIKQSLEAHEGGTSLGSDEKKELQGKFQVYLDQKHSIKDIETMIGTVLQFSKGSSANRNSRSKLRPTKPAKRKMISNKIKLIRLREELKAMKEGKKVEESQIVTNVGLVFGWVFWKSVFEGFSWLEEGSFIQNEQMNSAILAANWLHYSVGERDTVNPLILFICKLEEKEFLRLTETELEERMSGESLSNSIEGYYQLILSMWPIFDVEQLPDFIELFVDREGIIQDSPVGIKLTIAKEPIDALSNDKPVPWPISLINFSWSTQIIEVEW